MLTISKPLSAGQAQSYHAEEFGNARENYYTEGEQIRGEWHGRLAERCLDGVLGGLAQAARFAKSISSGSAKDNTRLLGSN